jgi:mannose-P-dolichol utilization defect protein 1
MEFLKHFDPMAILGKCLGVLIIVGSLLNKAPLFINILKSKSVAGMASSSVYSELIMYSNAAFYCVRLGHPFTAYGETLLITIQTVFVVILMWKYKVEPTVTMKERLIATSMFAVYLSVVFALPEDKVYLLLSINMPVTIFSRGSQVYCYYTEKHTGAQSVITVMMNFTGSAIRVFTTISEVGFDIPLLTGYAISLCMNATMITQFIIYKKNTEKHMKSLMEKKKD